LLAECNDPESVYCIAYSQYINEKYVFSFGANFYQQYQIAIAANNADSQVKKSTQTQVDNLIKSIQN